MDDQRLVQLALDQGHITPAQVADAQREQRALADRGLENSVWYLLQDLGHLTEKKANEVRKRTSSSSLRALEVAGYLLQGRLGAGGMGDVFRGRNAAGAEVAVKLLSTKFQNNEEYLRRFDREARTSMRLHHPHIARSLGAGVVHGTRYLLMEIVEGPSLKSRIQELGPINEREALCLLEQMAAALGHSWDEGVLHRDVKPANIIIAAARPGIDEPFCAKLIDFGLAKAWQDAEHSGEESRGGLTGAGLALGTPHYMSPEQASGQSDLDQRCDIYGLGASLYHALMGHTMYSGKSSAVIMYKQVTEQIDLSELRKKGARQQLVELLEKMLAKDRDKRIATWPEVLAATARVKALLHAGLGTAPMANAKKNTGTGALRKGTDPVRPATGSIRTEGPPQPVTNSLRMSAEIADALLAQQLAQATPPPISPTLRGQRQTRSRTPYVWAGVAVITVALGCAAWRLYAPGDGPQVANPAILAAVLRSNVGGAGEIHLEPGAYGSLRLGATAADLELHADRPGVVLAGLTGEAGLNALLSNIVIRGPLVLGPGAQLTLHGGSVDNILVDGGRLQVEGTLINGQVYVSHQGSFTMLGGSLAAGLRSEDSYIELRNGQLAEGARVIRGELRISQSTLAGKGEIPALSLDHCAAAELRQVTLGGAAVGLAGEASSVPVLEGALITASRVGIVWNGTTAPAWNWRGLLIHAPTVSSGLPAALLSVALPVAPAPGH
jgi:serine/threonine-protein kinase